MSYAMKTVLQYLATLTLYIAAILERSFLAYIDTSWELLSICNFWEIVKGSKSMSACVKVLPILDVFFASIKSFTLWPFWGQAAEVTSECHHANPLPGLLPRLDDWLDGRQPGGSRKVTLKASKIMFFPSIFALLLLSGDVASQQTSTNVPRHSGRP